MFFYRVAAVIRECRAKKRFQLLLYATSISKFSLNLLKRKYTQEKRLFAFMSFICNRVKQQMNRPNVEPTNCLYVEIEGEMSSALTIRG